MRKSTLTREPYQGRRKCQRENYRGRCTSRATTILTIVSYPTDRPALTSDLFLCEEHADALVASYEREWRNHPEMFTD